MKGQVAMEYLMNYSWVIISVTIALAIIIASGAFNPTSYNQNYCIGPSVIKCENIYGEAGNSNPRIVLKFRNDFGFKIMIRSLSLMDEKGSSITYSTYTPEWENSDSKTFEFHPSNSQISPGKMNRYTLNLIYSPCDESGCSSTLSYTIKKTIYVSPEKKS